jgi:hypothetical protein
VSHGPLMILLNRFDDDDASTAAVRAQESRQPNQPVESLNAGAHGFLAQARSRFRSGDVIFFAISLAPLAKIGHEDIGNDRIADPIVRVERDGSHGALSIHGRKPRQRGS